jgi:penicillin V acylase-like amidase (Ntn superfamily)
MNKKTSRILRRAIIFGVVFYGLVTGPNLMACSDIITHDSIMGNKWVVSGRNVDYKTDIRGDFVFNVAKNTYFESQGSDGKTGKTWHNDYAFTGIQAFDMGKTKFIDGLNEKGLSAAALWMNGAVFPEEAVGDSALALADVVAWVLGTQKSVADLTNVVQTMKVWYSKAKSPLPSPVHLVIHDDSGRSLVLEWIHGKLVLQDDKTYNGVLTNEPDYAAQIKNFNDNFKTLNNEDTYPDPDVPEGYLLGGGMLGMGGDQGSMSRFVRLFLLKKYASQIVLHPSCFGKPVYGAAWSIQQAFHIMNRVTGVHGEMKHAEGGVDVYPHTVLTIVRDHLNRKLYYRGYNSLGISYATIPQEGTTMAEGITAIDTMEDLTGDADVIHISQLPIARYAIDVNNNLSLSVTISVPTEKQGKQGKMYVFAKRDDGSMLSWNGVRWVPKEGAFLPCWKGKLEARSFELFKDQNMETWRGSKFYAGYGAGEADMFIGNTYALIYEENGEIDQYNSTEDTISP